MDSCSDDELALPAMLAQQPRRAHLNSPELDPFHILSDDSDLEHTMDLINDSSDNSDAPINLENLEDLRAQRLPCSAAAYPYSGTLLKALHNLHEDETKNFASLP
jgi:hypothetical protein